MVQWAAELQQPPMSSVQGISEVGHEGMELLVVLEVGGRVATQPLEMQVAPREQHLPPRESGHWYSEAAEQGRLQQAGITVMLGLCVEVVEEGVVEGPEEARRVGEVVAAVMVEVEWQ